MDTERKVAERKEIIFVKESVKASQLNKLAQGFEGDVIIAKKLVVDRELNIACTLHVIGGIVRKNPIYEFDINIKGDLFCYGEIHCTNINVNGYFYAEKFIYSRNIKVGENFLCHSKVDAFGGDVIVAGDLECYGIMAKKVRVFGYAGIYGSSSVSDSIKSGY